MRTRDLGRPWPVIVALVIVGGTALAQIPDSDGVIHGCYARNGALRVIDASSQACKRGETAISWNQAGPQGDVAAREARITLLARGPELGQHLRTRHVPSGRRFELSA